MLILNRTFEPLIKTIPDDTMIFAALDPDSHMSKKIVCENYINLYSKMHPYVGDVIMRFENLIDYESIQGIKRFFLPVDFLKSFISTFEYLTSLLKNGFLINMPVSVQPISFYRSNENIHHHMLIYGVDTISQTFYCKDFSDHSFVEFNVSYDDLVMSTELYNNPCSTESNGLLAFKIDSEITDEINFSKVYLEFMKMYYGKHAGTIDAYGLESIDFFISDIKSKPINERFFARWFETSNYLRESARLMQIRYNIISEELHINNSESHLLLLSKLDTATYQLFFQILKATRARTLRPDFANYLANLCFDCKSQFKSVSKMFMDIICDFV